MYFHHCLKPCELKIERIQAGDDFQMSNIKISFALKSSDEIFIKNLQVKDENFDFDFNPARLSIKNFKSSTADSLWQSNLLGLICSFLMLLIK